MNVSYRFAGLDEYDRLSAFLNDYWAAGHVYCREKALFDWSFARNPRWGGEGYCFLIAEANSEMAGMLGGIPFRMNCLGASSQGVWIANYVVKPEYRRGPLALQMLGLFRKPPFDIVIASGINPATATIYKVLRGEVLPLLPRHFAVLPGGLEDCIAVLQTASPTMHKDQAAELAAAFQLRHLPHPQWEHARVIPPGWDQHHWPALARETVGAARDAAFLEWRYSAHPLFHYCMAAVAEQDRTGLAIWRMEVIHKRTEAGLEAMGKIARIVEFLPCSRENSRRLLITVLHQAARGGAFAADFYGYHGETGAWLAADGFRSTGAEGAVIPTRFQPLDGKDGSIHCAMFAPEGIPKGHGGASCRWYWTKADSDQDRPN